MHPLAASGVVPSVLTRSKNVCNCSICKVVKSTKPGTKRTKPEGRPRALEKLFKKMAITICNQCFQSMDSLRGHTCAKVFGSTNLHQMIEKSLNQEAGEKLAADQIRAKFKESEIVSLKTGGRSLNVSNRSMKPTAECSHKDLMTIKVDRKLSGSDMEAISKAIWVKHVRKSITPGFKEFMVYNNRSLMEYFSAIDLDFYKSETGTLIVRPAVLVKDVEEFTWKMIEKRKQDAFNVKVKVFVDGGRGFFKLGIGTVDVTNYFSGDIIKRSNYTKGI